MERDRWEDLKIWWLDLNSKDRAMLEQIVGHKIDIPGLDEPERIEFEHAGHQCVCIKNNYGSWCGYVSMTPTNKYFGYSYDTGANESTYEKDGYDQEAIEQSVNVYDLEVHGGITYGSGGYGEEHKDNTWWKPAFNEKGEKLWWVGFDCSHAGDYTPGMWMTYMRYFIEGKDKQGSVRLAESVKLFEPSHGEVYRDMDYVMEETRQLAEQIRKAER